MCSSDLRLIVSSRTFNDQPLGTYGQFVPGHFYTDAIQYNEKATLIQLRQDNEYRTNVGFANVSDIAIDCIGDIYTSDGVYHGDFLVHLQPYMHAQIPGILSVMGLVPVQNAYIKVRTTTQNGKFFAYASTIDGRTGDGVYKPAVK